MQVDRRRSSSNAKIAVSAPPIPPPDEGKCIISKASGREICYPSYSQLDTSCTDVTGQSSNGLVVPPVVPHATVRAMAFVPPDNLRRLIIQYYRQQGKHQPKNVTFSPKSFLFVKYHCDYGYEMVDEVDTMFCQDKQWVMTPPMCRGQGLCAADNGGCSHTCISYNDEKIECKCPRGMTLDVDEKTCIKPVPKSLCRSLSGCTCNGITETQFACSCGDNKQKCLLLAGPPKIYIEPQGPYEVAPGGNINISCTSVAYPFPDIYWFKNQRVNTDGQDQNALRASQILIIKEIYRNEEFTCVADNIHGSANRTVSIVVTGPGSAPHLKSASAGRTSLTVRWEPPSIINRPITTYTLYYTNNPQQPVKNWKKLEVKEPTREVAIPDLRPDTAYYIRVRANDQLGPGKLGNQVQIKTLKPAVRPYVNIVEGDEIRVPPMTAFEIDCNVTKADPVPVLVWLHKGRPLNKGSKTQHIKMKNGGVLESTQFSCVAENEAGKSTKKINVTVTGPSAPERIRYQIDGDKVTLQWEQPQITNGPMAGYDVFYTDDPSLPRDQWKVHHIDDPNARTTTVPRLNEKTPYNFVIVGRNRLGPGLPSAPFTATTWLAAKPPVVLLEPQDEVTKEPSNDEMIIECGAQGVPKPKIIWLWSGTLIEDGKDEFRVYDTTPADAQDRTRSKLIAQSTTRSGVATCQAVNSEGSDEKKVPVKILGPGSAPLGITPTPMHTGFDVAWQPPKITNGRIKDYVVYYSKDPDAPLSDWESKTVPADTRNLTINVDDEDTPYVAKVQARTDDGPGIISEAYEVTTGRKQVPLSVRLEITDPTVDSTTGETIVEPTQPIHFRCVADGRPMPSVSYSWLPINASESGDEPVPIPIHSDENQPHHYNSIQVYSTTATKRILLCQARNPDGTVNDRHVFIVNKPGSAPQSVEVIVDPDNRVTVTWQPPKYPNGDITKYNVYITGDPSLPVDQWQVFPVDEINDPKLILQRGELQPETPYYVKIAAVNDHGEGIHTDPKHFDTVSGAPIDAPTDALPSVSIDNTVNITWSPPTQPLGPIKSYTVYFAPEYDDSDYKTWQRVSVDAPDGSDHGEITLPKEQFNPNTPYKVRISATNDLSEGPASDPVRFETGSGEIPPTITLEPSNSTYQVEPLGAVTITCTSNGVPQPKVHWIKENGDIVDSATLQLYDVVKDSSATCVAENNAGKTQEAVTIQVTGPGTAPNEIVLLPMPNQEINVEWTSPDEVNGQITNYIIHYGEISEDGSEPTTWDQVTIPRDDVNHKLANLEPKKTYAVRVQAVSDRGPGVISAPQVIKTLPLAPQSITNPVIQVHPNNSVTIEFTPPDDPENPGKKIKDFVIQYTTDEEPDDESEWKELKFSDPDDTDETTIVSIDGENFNPDTKYNTRIIARGEIDSQPSDPTLFATGDGVIAPSQPTFNVETEDGVIRVPAGTDYTIKCVSDGYPAPDVRWVDSHGNQLSDGPQLRIIDIRKTLNAKCLAENRGGLKETDLIVFVAGPGTAPENIQLTANKPTTISVQYEVPSIPNGNISKYIIYYTPLDDQDPNHQLGQVQTKPINEWQNVHDLNDGIEGPRKVDITDFINTDTAYAVVVQAINDDGPGPYSNQYTIRTMSRAREGPPVELRVEPDGQRSAVAQWKEPVTSDISPIGYEIYYVRGDKSVEEDDSAGLNDWIKISIDDPSKLSHKIQNLLLPDTDYVFKMRAIYPDGPSVFSEPCIMKTLPDGNAPYIQISTGDNGVEGSTTIQILPGSQMTIACHATGVPLPQVKWIKGGNYEIDPSRVDADGNHAQFSLQVANITEDTTFNCVAQNPLGHANWTIHVNLIEGLEPNWRDDFVTSKSDGGQIVLVFNDELPEYLKPPNEWTIQYTDDAEQPKDQWETIPSGGAPLTRVEVPNMNPGTYYYLVVDNPEKGIQTPTLVVMTPKPPSEIRFGKNNDDEQVVDFKPAITSEQIKEYTISVWPSSDPSNVKKFTTASDVTSGVVVDGLDPDTEYNIQVAAEFYEGEELASEPISVITPPRDVSCECEHACTFELNDEGTMEPKCYCHDGFHLTNDGKSCERNEEDDATSQAILQVTPPSITTKVAPEELPTASTGGEDDKTEGIISPIVGPDGKPLPVDKKGKPIDSAGKPIEIDSNGDPVAPEGTKLTKNEKGEWIYPLVDKNGKPLPVDENNKPIITAIDENGEPLSESEDGSLITSDGEPVKVDMLGRPLDKNGNPYKTNENGQFVVHDVDGPEVGEGDEEEKPQEIPLYVIDVDDDGKYVDEEGNEIPVNENGEPIDEDGNLLEKNDDGKYVKPKKPESTTSEPTQITILTLDGSPLSTDASGAVIGPDGEPIPTDASGKPLAQDGSPLPTDNNGNYVIVPDQKKKIEAQATDETGRIIYPIVLPDGSLLATDSSGNYVNRHGDIVEKDDEGIPMGPDGQLLSTDSSGNYVYPVTGPNGEILPTDSNGNPVYPVIGPDGTPLPTNENGVVVGPNGEPIPTDSNGKPLSPEGYPLPVDSKGNYVILPTQGGDLHVLATDETGNVIYPITRPDGSPLGTDSSGNFVTDNGEIIEKDDEGKPIGPDGQILPTDSSGKFVYPEEAFDSELHDSTVKPILSIVGEDGSRFPTDETGAVIGPDGEPIPTDASGKPLSQDGSPLPTDNNGNYILIPTGETAVKTQPTDREGKPIGPDGQVLPTDNSGNYIYPKSVDSHVLTTDVYGKPINTIIGPDGTPLPTDGTGSVIGPDGESISTDENGKPLDRDGVPLPTNEYGDYVFVTSQLPTDATGPIITQTPIIKPDGVLLATDSLGQFVNDNGDVLERDDEGRPLGPDGEALPTNDHGHYVYPATTSDGEILPTDFSGKTVYPVLGPDGTPLSTDNSGDVIGFDGRPIPTDASGKPLSQDGSPLPTDNNGNFILVPSDDSTTKVLPTDDAENVNLPITKPDGTLLGTDSTGAFVTEDGQVIEKDDEGRPLGPDGQVLPTDDSGNYIYPVVGPDGQILPTDSQGKTVYPVRGPDGTPLPTDASGAVIGPDGEPIPTDASGKPLSQDGSPLPTDNNGNYILVPSGEDTTKALATDETGNVIYPITRPDGTPLGTDSTGAFVTQDGQIIEKDDQGKPIGPDGQVLPTDDSGNYIYSVVGPDGQILPTDSQGKTVYPVRGPDGTPLPTDASGAVIGPDGEPIPTDASGKPLSQDGSPLPTDNNGNFILVPSDDSTTKVLPTDDAENVNLPITKPDGTLLGTDSTGAFVTEDGQVIEKDDEGRPLGPDGQVLPTDDSGNYIYPIVDEDGKPLSTDASGKPIYPVFTSDGTQLPTNAFGSSIDPEGELIPTDTSGKPLGKDGFVLPTDNNGRYVFIHGDLTKAVPTDENGATIYPITRPDGSLLPTDSTGLFLTDEGHIIDRDSDGKPYGPDGQVLPTDGYGNYVYPVESDVGGAKLLPTDEYGHTIFPVIRPDGSLLSTESSGSFVTDDGKVVSKDNEGKPLGPDGSVLPTDSAGNYIYPVIGPDGSPLPTDSNGKPVYTVIGRYGDVLPTDSLGRSINIDGSIVPTDDEGLPIDQYGMALPTDTSRKLHTLVPTRRPSEFCYVTSHIDLLLVIDSSNNIKVLDYRVMKELIKNFLTEHFNLRKHQVRVGLVKYGDGAEIPISLGDYDNEDDLVHRISESRRLKGRAQLGAGLREALDELSISGVDGVPQIVLVVKNGKASDDYSSAVKSLKSERNVTIFVVDSGDEESQQQNAELTDSDKVVVVPQWRGADSEVLGPIADYICKIVPNVESARTWPTPRTKATTPVGSGRSCSTVDYESDVIIVLDSSENFTPDEFDSMKDAVASIVDTGFDLAPDVSKIGFVIYSDKVAVPVALGHYEDKIELLEKIVDAEKINDGVAIALYGLNAARQQFQLHGRENATKIVLLITNGKNRGNAAAAAEDLRDMYGVQLFAVAVGSNPDELATIKRLVGNSNPENVVEVAQSTEIDDNAVGILKAICGNTAPKNSEMPAHLTTKRDVGSQKYTTAPMLRTTRAVSGGLCNDGIRRPYHINILIDITSRASTEEFRRVLDHLISFFNDRLRDEQHMITINIITVNSEKVQTVINSLRVDQLSEKLNEINQQADDGVSPKLGAGIDALVELSKENYISGAVKLMIIVSSDGTSSDDALPASEYANGDFQHNIIAISVRKPATDLLSKVTGLPTRVVHLDQWSAPNELFDSWIAYITCDYATASTTRKSTTPKMTTLLPYGREASKEDATNIELIPLSPSSISVSWTCCTNNKSNYTILYTHDTSIPKEKWLRKEATCRDSFGTHLDSLPSDHTYTICVMTTERVENSTALAIDNNCDSVHIDLNTTAPEDYVKPSPTSCNCQCSEGKAVLRATCEMVIDVNRPIATLPPATVDECPCKVKAHGGRCPKGYIAKDGQCYDIDECATNNGQCSEGCVNTPGSYYCACPHGMMRDPLDPFNCVNTANSFDKIAALLANYLEANAKNSNSEVTSEKTGGRVNYKATIKSEDDKTITFEWSHVPEVVRRAFKWLF
uniref:Ig-like domain-containing protein n=1 Tax=Caenorhabditis tropicalis TaxID=1561998 RepID=A0A1I7U3G2_9PELO